MPFLLIPLILPIIPPTLATVTIPTLSTIVAMAQEEEEEQT